MTVLSSELRSALERAIVAARDAAEAASRVALDVLGVDAERVPDHLHEDERGLRVALRAEARQLGGFERLVEECAYEQWHRMMFARFLAENDLLIHPEHGVAVSLADCEEIAHDRGLADLWVVASEFAAAMLPGIFRSDDPALRLQLAPEGEQALEEILAGLPPDVFTSDDGLGWVYQYWQAKKKEEVSASERKIGGADIAPVTQLFTEHYMVRFLLENTLGAWWAAQRSESPLVKEWEYLRLDEDGRPAAGSFRGWPASVADVTVMDPCCGSGHFLVTAFEMLRRMRMEAEDISAREAGDAVLHDNLFGLELDARCTQIAAFALALQAWKSGGYRKLPVPNIACSGISAAGRLDDWKRLAVGDDRVERSMERLHVLFRDAADLGSLIDPLREADRDLLTAEFERVGPLLEMALGAERAGDPSAGVFGSAATAALRAVQLLSRNYVLVVTNVPYLGRGKQNDTLKEHLERNFNDGKADLATGFLLRCMDFCDDDGSVAVVLPQNSLFLKSYSALRKQLLAASRLDVVARLGSNAFRGMNWWAAITMLLIVSRTKPCESHEFVGIDVGDKKAQDEKARLLRSRSLRRVLQLPQLKNAGHAITFTDVGDARLLAEFVRSVEGLSTGDADRYLRKHWELDRLCDRAAWDYFQVTPQETDEFGGYSEIVFWERGKGELSRSGAARIQGQAAWGRNGVLVSKMNQLKATRYLGVKHDKMAAALVPHDPETVAPLWALCSSPEYHAFVREVSQKVDVATATLVQIPFDLDRWQAVATEKYPDGLPEPESNDPTQWLFHGHPQLSALPLHVGAARLVGYRWPVELDTTLHVSQRSRELAQLSSELSAFVDQDGIVCLPSVRGERPAPERLRALLAPAFGGEWSSSREADLLGELGYAGKSLELWLRDGFFEQHCQLFHQRPFVWQLWDGRKDGFSVFVNYHLLDRAALEKLAYTYLGDWIRQQQSGVEAGRAGSELRLGAAQELQAKLRLILDGEPPYDIFVRWKPVEEQPLGWEPDLNDGVRLNIRPFVRAGVLRKNPKINWNKDRGKDPETAPWRSVFNADRINDYHLTLADKRAAREAAARRDNA